MTFREKLGNFISGGKLEIYRGANRQSINTFAEMECEILKLRKALMNIHQQETVRANATVTRMARIAREALGE